MNRLLLNLAEDSLDDYLWLINSSKIQFMSVRLRKMLLSWFVLMFSILSIIYLTHYLNLYLFVGVFIFSSCLSYFVFKWDYWKIKSVFLKKQNEVYKSFPLWASTLEILIVSNNITNTFKQSIPTCPVAIRKDLENFVAKIELDPNNSEVYHDFLSKYKIPEISEIIMDMYAFNRLDKKEILYEFKALNTRLNEMNAKTRKAKQNQSLFFIAALNSIPLLTVSIYILMISNLISII